MKKRLLFVFVFSSGYLFSQQYVLIPDRGFANYLRYTVSGAMKGDSLDVTSTLVTTSTQNIFARDPDSADSLDGGIKNLQGIQYFHSLIYLDCSQNKLIATLPALPQKLQTLKCDGTGISQFPALPFGLRELSCRNCQLTRLPPIQDSLRVLDFTYNSVSVLPIDLKALQIIRCDNNALTCLPALPKSLLALSCSWNSLSFLPPLPEGLKELYCVGQKISCFPDFPLSISKPFRNSDTTGTDTLWYNLRFEGNPATCVPNYLHGVMRPQELAMPLCAAGSCALEGNVNTCSAEMRFYPNPSSGIFTVRFDKAIAFTLQLFDLSGKCLITQSEKQQLIIDVSLLIDGVYLVNITTGEGVFKKKLVILR